MRQGAKEIKVADDRPGFRTRRGNMSCLRRRALKILERKARVASNATDRRRQEHLLLQEQQFVHEGSRKLQQFRLHEIFPWQYRGLGQEQHPVSEIGS
ncbi:hypothetical protein V6N11_049483 [Hibiscus sabdariffa]|uniref:Uncharacterized protein n=2 Tax=Hibiscus sabdariffa TaxID=183260 RepID=A0ABR2BPP2_9ROSI